MQWEETRSDTWLLMPLCQEQKLTTYMWRHSYPFPLFRPVVSKSGLPSSLPHCICRASTVLIRTSRVGHCQHTGMP